MKSFFTDFIVFFMSIVITMFGVLMFAIWLEYELSFWTFLMGLVGYIIGIRPTVLFYIEIIKDSFKKSE
jgi:hypothetical protein